MAIHFPPLHFFRCIFQLELKASSKLKPWPEASGCCRDVRRAARERCREALLGVFVRNRQNTKQNKEHLLNPNTNMVNCDDYIQSGETVRSIDLTVLARAPDFSGQLEI